MKQTQLRPNHTPLTPDDPMYVQPFHIGVPKHMFIEDYIKKARAEMGHTDTFCHIDDDGTPLYGIPYNAHAEKAYGKYVASLKARLEEMRKPDAQPVASKPLPLTKYNLKFF